MSRAMRAAQRGLTLLETLLVMVILGLASSMVMWSLRAPEATVLEREAMALAARLEAARTMARAEGRRIEWRLEDSGYAFSGLAQDGAAAQRELEDRYRWSRPEIRVEGASSLSLPPEVLIPPSEITLVLSQARAVIHTDGWTPFRVRVDG